LQQIRNASVLNSIGPPTVTEVNIFNTTGAAPPVTFLAEGSVAATHVIDPATFVATTPISASTVASSVLGTDSSGDSSLLQ
jgi:hypothetical protein